MRIFRPILARNKDNYTGISLKKQTKENLSPKMYQIFCMKVIQS